MISDITPVFTICMIFMNIFDTGFSKEDSYVRYTPLASCKIEEVEPPKQKI